LFNAASAFSIDPSERRCGGIPHPQSTPENPELHSAALRNHKPLRAWKALGPTQQRTPAKRPSIGKSGIPLLAIIARINETANF